MVIRKKGYTISYCGALKEVFISDETIKFIEIYLISRLNILYLPDNLTDVGIGTFVRCDNLYVMVLKLTKK